MALRGLQLREGLTLLIAVIVLAAGTITFFAVYRGTGAALRGQLEDDLRDQASELAARRRRCAGSPARPPGSMPATCRSA